MGLVPFGQRRVGFWMPGRPERALEEVPAGLSPVLVGSLDPEGSALVVAAAAPDDEPEWALVLYSQPGAAAVLIPWRERLFIALGSRALLLNEDGSLARETDFGEEIVGARLVPQGLLLLTRTALLLSDETLGARFRTELGAGQLQLLEASPTLWRLAHLRPDDSWDEVEVDALSGALISRTQ